MEQTYTEQIQINKKNKLAGMYPAAKFWVVVLYSACAFILDTIHLTKYNISVLLMLWMLVYILLCALSGEFKKCMKASRSVFFVAAIIMLVQTFLVPGGYIVWQWGFLKIYSEGLIKAISLTFMVLDVAGIFVWFFQTTEDKEIAQCLDEKGVNYKVAYVFISTLKMINVMSENSKTIMNAQRARGVETEGNLLVRMKAFIPSLIPLVLGGVTSAEERVLTLEARGFSINRKKTHLFVLKKSGIELPVEIIAVIVTIGVVIARIIL